MFDKDLFCLPCYYKVLEIGICLRTNLDLLLLFVHCSAVITRSSGAMNTDRIIRGPRYTEHDVITTPTCTTAVSSSYYEILHIACMLYCMFLFYLFIFYFFFLL